MRSIENRAFSMHHTPEELMDEAGFKIAQKILHYYPNIWKATAYIGKGHNAGDAIVVLQHLKEAGWEVNIQTNILLRSLAPLTQKKIISLGLEYNQNQKRPTPGSILIDGLLGIGAKGPLRNEIKGLAEAINHHRNEHDCTVVALDIPSGLNGDTADVNENTVVADHTITIGFPKVGLLNSQVVDYVGAISLVTLEALKPEITEEKATPHLISEHSLTRKRRNFSTHKGQAGRVAIWAGSTGMLGAAALTTKAALLSGAGLITVFIEPSLYPILATMVPPEIMLRPSSSPLDMTKEHFDTFAIGPGIGSPSELISDGLIELIKQSTKPIVIDADMLNLIAKLDALSCLPPTSILTPHPGEMRRIFPASANLTREETVLQFLEKHPVTLLYKGARTIVAQRESPIFVNSSGSPAMATAGQGDVLTGLITGLCAQGYQNLDATKLAAWIAGEAAQIALAKDAETHETLTASSTLHYLHSAFAQVGRTK